MQIQPNKITNNKLKTIKIQNNLIVIKNCKSESFNVWLLFKTTWDECYIIYRNMTNCDCFWKQWCTFLFFCPWYFSHQKKRRKLALTRAFGSFSGLCPIFLNFKIMAACTKICNMSGLSLIKKCRSKKYWKISGLNLKYVCCLTKQGHAG